MGQSGGSMIRDSFLRLFPLVLVSVACAAEPGLDRRDDAIIGGTATSAFPEVVAVVRTNTAGTAIIGICSGTAIGSRRVLTAKHCVFTDAGTGVPASRLQVIVGPSIDSPTRVVPVQGWATATGGAYSDADAETGNDIAILRTATDIGVTPREVARAAPRSGNPTLQVGYGVDDRGDSGAKRQGTSVVGEVIDMAVDPAGNEISHIFSSNGGALICNGDSGGPAFDGNGRIIGVTSFGTSEDCSSGNGWFSEVAHNIDFIEAQLGGDAPCTPSAETCNGADDNCDDFVDEGCTPLGGSCFDSRECASELCAAQADGTGRCIQGCDPTDANPGCGAGQVCSIIRCGVGVCEDGTPGSAAICAECTRDAQCATNYCFQRADGGRYCARPCREGGDACAAGYECITDGLECGGCLPPPEPGPLGAFCADPSECLSGVCHADGFCTQDCSSHAECPGMRCDGQCVQGDPIAVNEPCESTAECVDEASCVDFDDGMRCRASCAGGCDAGFVCDGDVCRPDEPLLGEPCGSNEECLSNICAGTCTRICTDVSQCPDGFECRPAGAVSGCFPPASSGGESGGCRAGASDGAPAATLGLIALTFLVRRRRR